MEIVTRGPIQNSCAISDEVAPHVFSRTMLAMTLLWLSFPPVGFWPLAWIALIPLVAIVIDRHQFARGSRRKIWIAGLFYWLGTFYFIPIPHPLLWVGWLAVSLYLACYLPIFVLSTRAMIHVIRIPAMLAIPVAWTGIELIRSWLFTGMGLVCLSHTQFQLPVVIQVSDLSGAYMLSYAMVTFTTGITLFLIRFPGWTRLSWPHLFLAMGILAAVLGYGKFRLEQNWELAGPPLTVALIQGSIDTTFPATGQEARAFFEKKNSQYRDLAMDAINKWEDLELMIWPENGWSAPDLLPDTDLSEMPVEDVRLYADSAYHAWTQLFVPGRRTPPMLVGAGSANPVKNLQYGSVILIDEHGETTDRYFKNHLVMFGEYVPLANWIPLLQRIPAIGKGLDAGTQSIAININDFKLAPSICFETTVPHYIRNQVNQLAAGGNEPDVLVNVTNDGWFYGTSALDFHLACNVFRAVELRKPHLVCANTGLSAHIDAHGRIEQLGPRRQTKTIRAQVAKVDQSSLYRTIGDAIPIALATITIFFWLIGMFPHRGLRWKRSV